jgi:hypothetical protein
MYQCKYFKIQELVPPEVFEKRGYKSWELMDQKMLIVIDRLRDMFGPMIINNWHIGGERKWSGLRTPDSPYYSPYSQHTFGRAFDIIFTEAGIDDVRRYILNHESEFPEIGGVELDTSWLHIDGRNANGIRTFTA